MKIIKKKNRIVLLLMVLAVIVLTGCAKEQSATYLVSEDEVKTEITLKAKGDEVYEQVAVSQLNYDILAVLDESDAKKKMAERATAFKGVAGVDYEVAYSGEQIVETITIDYHQVEWEELAEVEGFFLSSEEIKTGISFKGTIEALDSTGAQKLSSES